MRSPELANRPASRGFGDLASTARRNLAAGETLDGEGGYSEVAVKAGQTVRWDDCVVDQSTTPSSSDRR
jgi:predicted homoserine dehydrogenase-like protein